MNCEETQELLEAYHDEELTAETRSAVAVHVKTCARCTAALAQLGELSGAIKAVGSFPVPESLRRNVEKLAADASRTNASAPRRFGFGTLAASHIGIAAAAGLAAYALVADSYSRSFYAQECNLRACAIADGRSSGAGSFNRQPHGASVVCRQARFFARSTRPRRVWISAHRRARRLRRCDEGRGACLYARQARDQRVRVAGGIARSRAAARDDQERLHDRRVEECRICAIARCPISNAAELDDFVRALKSVPAATPQS